MVVHIYRRSWPSSSLSTGSVFELGLVCPLQLLLVSLRAWAARSHGEAFSHQVWVINFKLSRNFCGETMQLAVRKFAKQATLFGPRFADK